MILRIVLIWIFFLGQLFYSATCSGITFEQGSEMSYSDSGLTDWQMTDRLIRRFIGITLPDCVLECELRQHCLALSYHRLMHICVLLRTTTELTTESENYIFRLKSDIIRHQIPCEQECNDNMTCDSVSKTCKHKECSFPNPVNARVLGNMVRVGSKVIYKCNCGTYEVNKIFTATCLENGTWSYIANCIAPCDVFYQQGYVDSGVYLLKNMNGRTFNVWCDLSSDIDGKWIVIQRRVNDSDFYKTWEEYKTGFGDLNGNFWLGNENIRALTKTGSWMLRFDLTYDGEEGFAEYSSFSIGEETTNYALHFDAFIDGNIGDSLTPHKGLPFTTKDRDNDHNADENCAQRYIGAWWYNRCHWSNLNGVYGSVEFGKGLNWYTWKGHFSSVTTTKMKIRRVTEA